MHNGNIEQYKLMLGSHEKRLTQLYDTKTHLYDSVPNNHDLNSLKPPFEQIDQEIMLTKDKISNYKQLLIDEQVIEPSKNTTQTKTSHKKQVTKPSEDYDEDYDPSEDSIISLSRVQRGNANKRKAINDAYNKQKKGGFIQCNRGDYKAENDKDSLASGKKNECLPDAISNASAARSNFLNISNDLLSVESRSIMPSDGSDPNIYDAKKLVESKGLSLKLRNEFYMNPLALLNNREGFYIIKLVVIYKDERTDDNHFTAYNELKGHLIDNDQYK